MSKIDRPLHPALQAYLGRVKALAGSYTPSLFWERQLTTLHESPAYANIEKAGAPALETMVAAMTYGFTELDAGVRDASQDPTYIRAAELAQQLHASVRGLTAENFGVDKEVWEHARALLFLRRERLLAEYLSFITSLGVRSSMSVARHYFYAHWLRGLARTQRGEQRLRVLEIGAGAGNLAVFLHRMSIVDSYCVVDLPEMLVHSGYTISAYIPEAAPVFEPPTFDAPSRNVWFVAPQEIDRIPDATFDLCLNFNSFMEMDQEMLSAYFRLVYRAGRTGALFVNVNRRQRALPQRDGSLFDNNPLLYPYRNTDRVLHWEEETFQQTVRSGFGKLPSLAVLRAAVINPA